MHILFDVRPLLDRHYSGVGMYTRRILEELVTLLGEEDSITLWYNSAADHEAHMRSLLSSVLIHPRVHLFPTRQSNKLFTLQSFLGLGPRFEVFLKHHGLATSPDMVFMPDLRPLLPSDLPLVTTIHDMSYYDWPQGYSWKTRLWHQLVAPRTLLQRSNRLIAVSHFTKERILAHSAVPPERIAVVYEDASFGTVSSIPIQRSVEKPYMVTLCTLEPRKNLPFAIQGFISWNATQQQKHTLYVLGAVNERIFKQVLLPQDPHVVYCGAVTEKEKVAYIHGATALLYLSHYEGFGLPLVEAMKLGTPCVISPAAALVEVTGPLGMVVDPLTEDQYHTVLTTVTSSEAQKSLRGQAKARGDFFSWCKAGRETMEVLRSLE